MIKKGFEFLSIEIVESLLSEEVYLN